MKKPIHEGDERIFTLSDVKRLYIQKKSKIKQSALLGALLVFFVFLLKTPHYKIEATFKEGIENNNRENALKDFLGGGLGNSEPQAIVLMKSFQVIKPLVERLGLNAEIPERGGVVSKLYRRIRDNCRAEMGKTLTDRDWFEFKKVSYEGEETLSYWIRFDARDSFFLYDAQKKLLTQGIVGQEINLPEVRFTLDRIPTNLLFHRLYPLKIASVNMTAQKIRDKIDISSQKMNKSIYQLVFLDRNRVLGVKVLNELMSEYRNYLKKDHDQVAQEQLAYLETKQEQMYGKLAHVFDEHANNMKQSLENRGFVDVMDESSSVLAPLRRMESQMLQIEVELSRLSQFENEECLAVTSEEGTVSKRFLEISEQIQALKQQKDILEVSLQYGHSLDATEWENRQRELNEIRKRRDASQELLSALDSQKEISLSFPFDPENVLASWAARLETGGKADLIDYLHNHIRLLSVQEKMMHERFFHASSDVPELEGLSPSTAERLFADYSAKLASYQVSLKDHSRLLNEIDHKDFALSSLSAVLTDSLSRQLIEGANRISLQLKDEKYHSAKEGERWEEELALQRRILKDHLYQLCRVDELNISVIREKLTAIQQTTLDSIHQQISVLNEQAVDALKDGRKALLKEKEILEKKMADLRLRACTGLPDRWREQQWLQLKSEMGTKMMLAMTELVESKTIGHHLHHVESKPLDLAILPRFPEKPLLFVRAVTGGLSFGFIAFFVLLFPSILKGFPSSMAKLRAMNYPVLGEIDFSLDGSSVGEPKGSSLELLRQISLFMEIESSTKTVSLIAGKGPDYSYCLAENLARRSIRSVILRCDFHAKSRSDSQPGLLQIWKGEIAELPIRKQKGFDVITAGGFSSFGLEIVQSASFHQLLEFLKKQYDLVFLLFRSPLDRAESIAALRFCDRAIVTVCQEPTEELTPFINWAYHEEYRRLSFIVVDS